MAALMGGIAGRSYFQRSAPDNAEEMKKHAMTTMIITGISFDILGAGLYKLP